MNWLQYVLGGGALLTAVLVWLFQRRGQTIASLETALKIQPGQIAIDLLKKETDETAKMAIESSDNFDSLKRANAELAAKLGLNGTNSPRDSKDH